MEIPFKDDEGTYTFSFENSEEHGWLIHFDLKYEDGHGGVGGTRGIINGRIEWAEAHQFLSPSAMQFIERVFKLKAFL